MSNKKIIFGLGTGRCGTMSLSYLLNFQNNASFSHEVLSSKLPWDVDCDIFEEALDKIKSRDKMFVGDVGSYYLPYFNNILKIKNSKFIILQRDKNSVIKSFMKKTRGMNHWSRHDGSRWRYSPWDKCFPKFKEEDKYRSIGLYYDLYYKNAKKIPEKNTFWIKTENLNNKDECLKMLNFCGFENPRFLSFKKNMNN